MEKRYEYFVLTSISFLVGVLLYGIIELAVPFANNNSVLTVILIAFGGGYLFFSIFSGIFFTVRWLSGMSFRGKIIMTVFFVVPVWTVIAGVFYSIPYGIYNFYRYKKLKAQPQQKKP